MRFAFFRIITFALLALGGEDISSRAASNPVITNFSRTISGQPTLRWTAETNSFTNVFFTVQGATNLNSNFTPLSSPISENTPMAYTDVVESASSAAFYRVVESNAFTALNQPGAFTAYAATNVNGLNTVGYAGAVFDGHYVYFVPYQSGTNAHGRVLRYDTQGGFTNASSWSAYDATNAVGTGGVGYTGGIFDGHYVYFSPTAAHGRVLRYDTQGNFTNASSWTLYDASATDGVSCKGFQGAIFDGRYVYFVPHFNTNFVAGGWNGLVLRYDTQNVFTNAASWHAYDAGNTSGQPTKGYSSGYSDGRYVYFSPIVNGVNPNGSGYVLRYDSLLSFTNATSWLTYNASNTSGLNSTSFKGAVSDGRYIYFSPYPNFSNCVVLRYDSQSIFTNAASWVAYNATNTGGIWTDGYDGCVFDGRFVYFVPYHDSGSVFHGRVLRCDTQGVFTNSASWSAIDAGNTSGLQTQGYVGAIFDGRYIYFAPYFNVNGFSGNVLRFDAKLPRAIPATVSGGSNL